jgi:transposase-like protein
MGTCWWKKMVMRPHCGSQKYFKDAVRQTGIGKIQRYLCRECGCRFSFGKRNIFSFFAATGN